MCLGIPGQIVRIVSEQQKTALADVSGIQREVNVACVVDNGQSLDELIGSWVLIHVGFAMSIIDQDEAYATLDLLARMGDLQAEQSDMLHSDPAKIDGMKP